MEALVERNWGEDELDYCECPGPPPPPQFQLPPPPARCAGPLDDGHLHFCQQEVFGAELTHTIFPSLPIIVVCSSVVLVALLVASFLLWKHKKKVQNFLPCKSEHQGHCDLGGPNGVTYDDVLINHHPTRLPNQHDPRGLTPIEVSMLLDVKYGPPTHLDQGRKDHFNPIYEEVSEDKVRGRRSYDSDLEESSEAEGRTVASEDEFAEDELSLAEFPAPGSGSSSLRGSTGGDLCVSDGEDTFRAPCRSLERNKDGHPSDGFLAKQNYYMSKGVNCEARLLLRPENIYAIVEEEATKAPPHRHDEEGYGDMRPVYDARALCT